MEVPAALSGPAEDGLPTLSQLQASFPDAARAALDAAIRADTGSEAGDRLFSFLRVQTGMRSLTPREGDDPDAILSRAEAALRGGDLGTVLTELEGLPETGRSEMTGWEDVARVRLEALAAAEALSSSLNTN